MNGYFVSIEIKKDAKEKPKKLQEYHGQGVREAGGEHIILTPENLDATLKKLKQISKRRNKWASK